MCKLILFGFATEYILPHTSLEQYVYGVRPMYGSKQRGLYCGRSCWACVVSNYVHVLRNSAVVKHVMFIAGLKSFSEESHFL
jgi:hypothetical protein